ncbi:MAG: hypothetical protein ABR529_10765 [Actinomycetota bacterium]
MTEATGARTEKSDVDLSSLWLPLLAHLTERFPRWGLWKNADRALAGHGDFDSTAPLEDWDAILAEFHAWAAGRGYGPVAACSHVAGVLFLIALDEKASTFLELDVNARKYFRGWTLFRPENLAPLMEIDERGFRRVRPGAEGVILLTQNGLRWGGRPDPAGLARKRVAELLRADPEGVRAAARLFGPTSGALVAAAEGVAAGGWNRRAMLTVEAWAVLRALAAPHILATRLSAKRVKKRCPVLRAIFADGRRTPRDVGAWLSAVAEEHPVLAGRT